MHIANIDQGFLSTLGPGFMTLLYRAIDESASSVLICEQREGRVIGFVAGAHGMGPIYRRMLRRPVALGLAMLPSLLRPRRVLRIIEILTYGREAGEGPELPDAELLSIAVDPASRGQHIADSLYEKLRAHFRATGVVAFKITVGAALGPAHRFYLRMGARPVAQTQVHKGEASTVYVHEIPAP